VPLWLAEVARLPVLWYPVVAVWFLVHRLLVEVVRPWVLHRWDWFAELVFLVTVGYAWPSEVMSDPHGQRQLLKLSPASPTSRVERVGRRGEFKQV